MNYNQAAALRNAGLDIQNRLRLSSPTPTPTGALHVTLSGERIPVVTAPAATFGDIISISNPDGSETVALEFTLSHSDVDAVLRELVENMANILPVDFPYERIVRASETERLLVLRISQTA